MKCPICEQDIDLGKCHCWDDLMDGDYLPEVRVAGGYNMSLDPQDGFCLLFTDETSEKRSQAQIDSMMREFEEVADKYGYSVNTWGKTDNFAKFLCRTYLMDLLDM